MEANLGRSALTVATYEPILYEAIPLVVIDETKQIVDLFDYRDKISDDKPKTIAKKISALRSFFEWVREKGFRFRLKGLESTKTPKSLPKPVPHNHIIEAIKEAGGENELILWLLYALGLRISEASNLRIADITDKWVRVVGKGNKMRQVPMIETLKSLINRHIEATNPKEFLFEANQKQLSENQLRYKIITSFEKIGLKATPHQLRHAFATEMINAGARITDVSELLGHAQLGTTEIYTKLTTSTKLNSYLSSHPLCKDK